jgi:hypothetical protein
MMANSICRACFELDQHAITFWRKRSVDTNHICHFLHPEKVNKWQPHDASNIQRLLEGLQEAKMVLSICLSSFNLTFQFFQLMQELIARESDVQLVDWLRNLQTMQIYLIHSSTELSREGQRIIQ